MWLSRRKVKYIAPVMCCILLICSCKDNNQVVNSNYLKMNDTIYVVQGILYRNISEGISLRLDSVPDDSRCPPEAVCFWQGNATPAFSFTKGNRNYPFRLNTFALYKTDTVIENYNIKLIGLNHPDYKSSQSRSYIATVLIRK